MKFVKFYTNFAKAPKKSHSKTLCKDLEQQFFWGIVLVAMEGLINRGFF